MKLEISESSKNKIWKQAAKTPDSSVQRNDSLNRIKSMQPEVWAVKLADRITNLQPPPPHWNQMKITQYHDEAKIIHNELKNGNKFLADRLKQKIEGYGGYIKSTPT